ncbi:MAG: DUF349 domain-containing protein [Flammeovirgaceae bacterium]|jgi:hypothetical protein|nr:DUF349 domain-containing protein [Flammeovirgaceae bacterium]|tara:strand:- start:124 stop:2160 length:2037 start_codon:yes stop_codon:yes gene_type:complete
MENEKPMPKELAEEQISENVQQEAELIGDEIKGAHNGVNNLKETQEESEVSGHVPEEKKPVIKVAKEKKPKAKKEKEDVVLDLVIVDNTSEDNELEEVKAEVPPTSEDEFIDLTEFNKGSLVEFIKELEKETEIKKVSRHLRNLKLRFDDLFNEEKSAALANYQKEEGVNPEDFLFKGDLLDTEFEEIYQRLNQKRHQFFTQLENKKEENLKKKNTLLDQLRDIVDNNFDIDIKLIKELQATWQAIGQVPSNQNKSLWANYNALMDRFYDSRSIYFELKDLDRKKNLIAKTELCEKAENLNINGNLNTAFKELNDLHEEYKLVGPVPRENQEELWQRFKTASDEIYNNRRAYLETLKMSFNENLVEKRALVEEIQGYANFESGSVKDWNTASKKVAELQNKWDLIGGIPREKSKEINKLFWGYFKQFFAIRAEFFKQFDAEKQENLEKKRVLVTRAEELNSSEDDLDKVTDQLKQLQSQWREIGAVPDKYRNKIYNQFKLICDSFFDKKRAKSQIQTKDYEENYVKKQAIIEELNLLSKSSEISFEQIFKIVDAYMAIGYVPRNFIKKMNESFDKAIANLLAADGISEEERNEIKMHLQVTQLKQGPQAEVKMHQKDVQIKRKISSLESDVNIWKTNIDFFSASKNADKLKLEFNEKIKLAEEELAGLKEQLIILRQA